ncbi:MAG TPA: IS110 family transposase [Bradyrhizobium sp.]|nr:IS110 family transposase [Bradyrhizobium sp.]
MTKIVCGVDVSKRRLDAHVVPSGTVAGFDNDATGIAALAEFCHRQGVQLVAMEATGGYERQPFLLWAAGIACGLTNPRSVRRYAEAMGTLEKTDRLDAGVIARFAIAKELKATNPPTAVQQRLNALVARLRQVTEDLTVNKQRRSSAMSPEMVVSLDEVIGLLKRQARALEGEIASMIDDDPLWSHLDAALRTTKGIANRTVARLFAELPEIGIYSNKAVVKLAGLAPLANDSGAKTGQRHIRGGRAGIRSILFLVADIARRFDPSLADFHRRLTAAGKKKMVVRIALARKLLVRLNAKAREARACYALAT